jgi:hypothetical protein
MQTSPFVLSTWETAADFRMAQGPIGKRRVFYSEQYEVKTIKIRERKGYTSCLHVKSRELGFSNQEENHLSFLFKRFEF